MELKGAPTLPSFQAEQQPIGRTGQLWGRNLNLGFASMGSLNDPEQTFGVAGSGVGW